MGLNNRIRCLTCRFSLISAGDLVLVDEAAEDGSAAAQGAHDPLVRVRFRGLRWTLDDTQASISEERVESIAELARTASKLSTQS
jgi:hypothetical protein